MAYIGVARPVIAKYEESNGNITYSEGFRFGKAIKVVISPNYEDVSEYGGINDTEEDQEFSDADIVMNTSETPEVAERLMFGHITNGDEVMSGVEDRANYVGMGIRVAVASEELGWSIKKMFGLNEKEVLTSDQKISTDDYSLSLVDMAYDGNIGRILIKLEALTKEAEKELKQLPGPVASKAASMCYYTDLSNEKEAYYWLDINGEQENIRINIPKSTQYLTVSLKKTIEPKSIALGKSEMYTKLEYSPLGITIWAEGDTDTNFPEDPGDVQITFRYKNGKEDVLTGKSSTEKKVGINHSSREAVQDDSFEGFRWIYGFSNRCDWTQIDAIGIDGVWYPL